MKKRVALFINSLYGGGAERVVSRISKELQNDYELFVLLIDGKNKFYECSGTVIDMGCKSNKYIINVIRATLQFNNILKKKRIDYVISFLDIPNILNCLLNTSTKKAISIRNYSDYCMCVTYKERIKYLLCQKAFPKSDKVIVVANELKERVEEQFYLEDSKICVIENPYDIRDIVKQSAEEIEDDIKCFIEQHKTAVAVGRLNKQKGYFDLLEIFEQVREKESQAALIILGVGEQMEQIEKFIQERNLEDCVKLLGLKKNPFAYMSKCDLYVSASLHEGFPNTLVESMACGLPIIHTDCMTGPREIIVDKVDLGKMEEEVYAPYGVLIPSYTRKVVVQETTRKQFANAWINMLESKDLSMRYKRLSIERAGYYSVEKCIEKYMHVIEEN